MLINVIHFSSEKLAEATRKFHELEVETGATNDAQKSSTQHEIDAGQEVADGIDIEEIPVLIKKLKSRSKGTRKLKELKFAVSEFYLSLILIQNFQVLWKLSMYNVCQNALVLNRIMNL